MTNFINNDVNGYPFVDATKLTVDAKDSVADGSQFVVSVSYDARNLPIWNLVPQSADAGHDHSTSIDDPGRGHLMRSAVAGMRQICRRLLRDKRANFAVMTALSAPVALVLTAFAVDQGALFNERRAAQSIVDLAAITAAANLNNAETAVLTTLSDNGISSVAVQKAGQPSRRQPPRRWSRLCRGATPA